MGTAPSIWIVLEGGCDSSSHPEYTGSDPFESGPEHGRRLSGHSPDLWGLSQLLCRALPGVRQPEPRRGGAQCPAGWAALGDVAPCPCDTATARHFSSMWHLGLLPASDEYTCVNTHTHYNINVSVIDTLIIPFASFI